MLHITADHVSQIDEVKGDIADLDLQVRGEHNALALFASKQVWIASQAMNIMSCSFITAMTNPDTSETQRPWQLTHYNSVSVVMVFDHSPLKKNKCSGNPTTLTKIIFFLKHYCLVIQFHDYKREVV